MKKILKWEVIYKIEPTLSHSETFQEYHFEVTNSATQLKREYETSVILDSRRIQSKTIPKTNPEKDIANDQRNIRKFLLKRMVFTKDFSQIKITHAPPILSNRRELEEDGFRITTPILSALTQYYSLLDVDSDSFALSDQYWQSGFNGDVASLEDSIFFISDWIERSVAETKAINSFMLLWVAFNCLYETFTTVVAPMRRRTHAIHRIDKTLHTLIPANDITTILRNQTRDIDHLLSYELAVTDREILEGIPIESDIEKLLVAMGHVYKVRNHLFHQGSLHGEIEKQSEIAKNILLPVITTSLKNLINY